MGEFRVLRLPGVKLHVSRSIPDDWAREAWAKVLEDPHPFFEKDLPEAGSGGVALIKTYPRRPSHGPWRRLRPSRAIREGKGYLAFAEKGLRTPELLLFGEKRRLFLHEMGAVATKKLDAPTVADRYGETKDGALLDAAAAELAKIHAAGLCHGDPFLRNFLATEPGPTAFDLASWSTWTEKAQRQDLVRFAASVLLLTEDRDGTRALIAGSMRERNKVKGPSIPDLGPILAEAESRARRIGRV